MKMPLNTETEEQSVENQTKRSATSHVAQRLPHRWVLTVGVEGTSP